MSTIRDGALFLDANGNAIDALVTAYDESTKTADLLILSPDPKKRKLLQGGDFVHGLERRYTVECISARYERLKAAAQQRADQTGTTQPAITAADLHDSFVSGVAPVLDPAAVFTPTPKPEEPAAEPQGNVATPAGTAPTTTGDTAATGTAGVNSADPQLPEHGQLRGAEQGEGDESTQEETAQTAKAE